MFDSRNLFTRKGKYIFGSLLLLLTTVLCVAFTVTGGDDFEIARREVLLRRIGHEVLLQSGDSTSRVLPVEKIAKNEYRISFENKLTFQPDSLVNITRRLLATDPFASDYVVNVLNTGSAGVAYGYAISKNKKDDIISCKGRKQPKAHYSITIKFKPTILDTAKSGYLLGGLPFLAFVGFIVWRSAKHKTDIPGVQDPSMITLGQVLFDVKNRKLITEGITTDLTATETRVLHIFASSPNETIERSRLQKEIWEDEGVIVGRRLDMFISKLRKKLEVEPDIKIVVVRVKGYRLQVTV